MLETFVCIIDPAGYDNKDSLNVYTSIRWTVVSIEGGVDLTAIFVGGHDMVYAVSARSVSEADKSNRSVVVSHVTM